ARMEPMPMDTERQVAEHYGRTDLEQKILAALAAAGKDIDRLTPADLSAGDEFHLGWRAATVALAGDLGLKPGMRVLDIGSGLGGPARYCAEAHGCTVVGVDITESYVDVANSLTARCGLTDRVSFELASALSLRFDAAAFDAATMIHV
ncbi:cyclopropane-fatty-acyl-phospholipid synthase family protein, partial [Bradyrhizobium sp. NBAIM08]|uniref:SAM-dependent methyltransferase n=1 Tax=Bradyrhizobium sp. NBAIM08 TaxID=2793815 RepID=UPI001CD64458